MQAEIDAGEEASRVVAPSGGEFLLNVGLTRTRVPTATPEDDRGEKAEPRRYALLTLIRHLLIELSLIHI